MYTKENITENVWAVAEALRHVKGWSASETARRGGWGPQNYVSARNNRKFSGEILAKLANAFGVPAARFLDFEAGESLVRIQIAAEQEVLKERLAELDARSSDG